MCACVCERERGGNKKSRERTGGRRVDNASFHVTKRSVCREHQNEGRAGFYLLGLTEAPVSLRIIFVTVTLYFVIASQAEVIKLQAFVFITLSTSLVQT